METSIPRSVPAVNPLTRLAEAVPVKAALAVMVTALLAGTAAAIYYAYDQDTVFPDRHFPRTWVMVGVTSALALLSIVPALRAREHWLWQVMAALGAGALVFGGANLAQRPSGLIVLIAGAVAWLSYAAVAGRGGGGAWGAVAGLALGFAVTMLTVGVCVVLVPN
jgi:hypothetical protein